MAKSFASNPKAAGDPQRFWLALLILVAGAVVALYVHAAVERPMIRDEAIELLQASEMKAGYPHFFAQQMERPVSGPWKAIEAFVPYWNSAFFAVFGYQSWPTHILNAVCYGLAVMFFFLAMRRFSEVGLALFNTFLFTFCAYSLLYNQFLVRNAVSILWSAMLFWSLAVYHTGRTERERWNAAVMFLPLALFMGNWTYGSFKIIAVACIFAIIITYVADRFWALWLRKRFWTLEGGLLFTGAGIFITALGSFLWITNTPFNLYACHGDMGLVDGRKWRDVWMTFLQPVFYNIDPFTPAEINPPALHTFFVRALSVLFYIGLFSAFLLKGRLWRLWFTLVWIWIIASGMVGLVGVHSRHLLYALVPICFALSSYGLHRVITAAKRSSLLDHIPVRWIVVLGTAALLIYYPYTELEWVLKRKSQIATSYDADDVGYRLAKAAKKISDTDNTVYVYCLSGKEVCAWTLKSSPSIIMVETPEALEMELRKLSRDPSKRTLLVVNDLSGNEKNQKIAELALSLGLSEVVDVAPKKTTQ